ncbi:hypothetical protein [Shewanella psychrotolerans]|uniref:hypothetical protein n=1 Tax=Shewanella psychrotolerans TaxID=2864206 RepID=UPI001C65A8B5|nr:hypothetical protein [Shewanella psychrotolerans]QYK00513.1 hypothetical protein K0I62_14055 [Shewanella psychrotolerans]
MSTSIFSKVVIGLGLVLTLCTVTAHAESKVTLNDNFQYDGQTVLLDMEVGKAEMIATDETEIRVEVVVRASNGNWLSFWSRADIDDVNLAVVERDNKLILKLDNQDGINQEWRVYLPRGTALEVDAGVGEVIVDGLTSSIDVDLGVGRAEIKHQNQYGNIALESGVGEVSVSQNGQRQTVEQSIVSQSYHSKNNDHQAHLFVSVGVGEISISN